MPRETQADWRFFQKLFGFRDKRPPVTLVEFPVLIGDKNGAGGNNDNAEPNSNPAEGRNPMPVVLPRNFAPVGHHPGIAGESHAKPGWQAIGPFAIGSQRQLGPLVRPARFAPRFKPGGTLCRTTRAAKGYDDAGVDAPAAKVALGRGIGRLGGSATADRQKRQARGERVQVSHFAVFPRFVPHKRPMPLPGQIESTRWPFLAAKTIRASIFRESLLNIPAQTEFDRMKMFAALMSAALVATPVFAQSAATPGKYAGLRDTYRELIETNTTLSSGSCTLAAERMAARLKAAGMRDDQLTVFFTNEHPKEGGLVAVYAGTSRTLKPMLLLAHIDVVEARREDWQRDPFTLVEENGYFYARGTDDDKAQAAIWVDTLARFAREKYRPARTIKLALTCGEETSGAFNGAEWLANNRRDLIDAEFALNEGGGGQTDGKALAHGGRLRVQEMQVGEKAYQDFNLTVTNPGGHSSQPVRDNAIYVLTDALAKVRDHEFPLEFSEVTRAYFRKAGQLRGGETGKAMQALAANPADKAAEDLVNGDKMLHSLLRTTCVATLLNAGHALNALPQRATANINCRMFPGRTAEETSAALAAAIGNPAVTIELRVKDKPIAKPPPLDPRIMAPVERLAAKYFPGVPVIPSMSTGATDGVYIGGAGIPTYGVPGLWDDPDGNGAHGLNERMEVRSLYTGRDYLYDLVKALAG